MTLIEIFSGSPIENFISTLALKPQKTIFVAPDTKKVWREIPRYKKILSGRGLQCEMDAVRASRNDLDDICGVLEGHTVRRKRELRSRYFRRRQRYFDGSGHDAREKERQKPVRVPYQSGEPQRNSFPFRWGRRRGKIRVRLLVQYRGLPHLRREHHSPRRRCLLKGNKI